MKIFLFYLPPNIDNCHVNPNWHWKHYRENKGAHLLLLELKSKQVTNFFFFFFFGYIFYDSAIVWKLYHLSKIIVIYFQIKSEFNFPPFFFFNLFLLLKLVFLNQEGIPPGEFKDFRGGGYLFYYLFFIYAIWNMNVKKKSSIKIVKFTM